MTERITPGWIRENRAQLTIWCGRCRCGVVQVVERVPWTKVADVEIATLWSAGRLKCSRCRTQPDSLTVQTFMPRGGMLVTILELNAKEPAQPREGPSKQKQMVE